MMLATHEFIRRFLMHVLPAGFHRIRYYGLLASGQRAENVARARQLLMPPIIRVDAIKAISPNAVEPNIARAEPDQFVGTRASGILMPISAIEAPHQDGTAGRPMLGHSQPQ
jgi:hypothetical protein